MSFHVNDPLFCQLVKKVKSNEWTQDINTLKARFPCLRKPTWKCLVNGTMLNYAYRNQLSPRKLSVRSCKSSARALMKSETALFIDSTHWRFSIKSFLLPCLKWKLRIRLLRTIKCTWTNIVMSCGMFFWLYLLY